MKKEEIIKRLIKIREDVKIAPENDDYVAAGIMYSGIRKLLEDLEK